MKWNRIAAAAVVAACTLGLASPASAEATALPVVHFQGTCRNNSVVLEVAEGSSPIFFEVGAYRNRYFAAGPLSPGDVATKHFRFRHDGVMKVVSVYVDGEGLVSHVYGCGYFAAVGQ
jgi:hypothetical protein